MYCPFCGIEIPDHASMCTHCGSMINLPPELTEGDVKRFRRKFEDRHGIKRPDANEAFADAISMSTIPALFISRFIAFIFDLAVIVGITILLMQQNPQISELGPLLSPIYAFLYFSGMTSIWGRTIGKMIVGIRVVGNDMVSNPDLLQSISRTFLSVFSFLFLFAGVIAPMFDNESKAWHDKLSGTMVIYKR